ncbi:NADP-dependent 3-hydroxy acid dehydrogenase YdfG [Geodermatophilus normandii]|uniref:NADP-dependent 3-hydroxy acid dehydrogenase YdfG n=1 Tax=Geodermatophilus normandii TaxID=1137989 RepID=A0A317QT94_9ACTN|nr:SDR family oxidoreductase [Geodermatophilus normandii]PWW24960.1 NADP-dependent 3-hydroxy acid dehydrogenase YdfG [Geodermatophilus normandii]
MDNEQRTVLITGCSSGLGLETAVELAGRGWQVVASMRDPARRAALDARTREAGLDPLDVVQLDVTDAESAQRGVKEALELTGGRLDALVSNAGTASGGAFEETDEEEWRRVLDTNLFGAMRLTQLVLPVLREQRSGRLVLVSSDSARYGNPGLSLYCASKWALEGWAESLAYEVEPFGVGVVLVEPGNYDTAIWTTTPRTTPPGSPYAGLLRTVERFLEEEHLPRSRDPREVARAVARALTARRPAFRVQVGPDARIAAGLGKLPYRVSSAAVRRLTGLHRWKP